MMRIPVMFIAAAVVSMILAATISLSSTADEEVDPSLPTTELEEPLDVAPYPTTRLDVSRLCAGFCPDAEDLVAMERMAYGIWAWKTAKGARSWWWCGVPRDGDEALQLAGRVTNAIWEGAYEAEQTVGVYVNPWGIAGTAANESSFDICAFGLHPRKAAYELRVLKPNRRSVSHQRSAVLAAINSQQLERRFRSYDLGMLQTLDRYYKGAREELLTWRGLAWQISHMADRAHRYGTDRPWRYWPGYSSDRYDRMVTRYAKKLGALDNEI